MPETKILEETAAVREARRTMEVCNACRYCEGFCAVFPAMERRRDFAQGDLNFLANLCHGCNGCYYACQYAPPHEFGINVPATFSAVRAESYAQYAWPAPLAAPYRKNGLFLSILTAAAVTLVLVLAMALQGRDVMFASHELTPGGGFYEVIPYGVMVWVASTTFLFSCFALAVGFYRFWKDIGGGAPKSARGAPVRRGLQDAATLTYLGGGGHGCNDTDENFGFSKRRCHHFVAYGFALCFASTSVATVYHHGFGWLAPYAFFSVPVLLGTMGGLGLMVGCAGLFGLKLVGDQAPRVQELLGADTGLLALLFLLAFSGLLLLGLRATGAMGIVLAVHLGLVLTLFLTLPYSKMVHGLYRTGALIRYASEREPGSDIAISRDRRSRR